MRIHIVKTSWSLFAQLMRKRELVDARGFVPRLKRGLIISGCARHHVSK